MEYLSVLESQLILRPGKSLVQITATSEGKDVCLGQELAGPHPGIEEEDHRLLPFVVRQGEAAAIRRLQHPASAATF